MKLKLLTLLLASTVLLAANPHFVGTPTATVEDTTLTVDFKVAGLGDVDTADFNLSGEATIFSRCYNHGGNKPQADNKQETVALSSDATFPVRNGQTTGSMTLTAPEPTLECPGNQVVVTESVTFSNVVLSGQGLTYSF